MSKLEDVILRDDRASQPAASAVAVGTLYYVTDESVTERSNGTTWDDFTDAGGSGSVATDAIWDAKGDLAGGTGADTASILTVGSNGTALVADSSATTGLAWEAFTASRRTRPFYSHDFGVRPSTLGTSPWLSGAIASGTNADVAAVANHPGIISFLASASANSGYYMMWGYNTALLITGGEYAEFIVNFQTLTNTTAYFGFHDSLSSTAPTDGCWINVSGTTLDGKCKNNAGPSSTGSTYTITTDVWYRMSVTVNSDASSVQFKVVTCSNGATVFDQAVTGNIPTATGRECGHGFVLTNNTASGTPTIAWMDYMAVGFDSTALVR